MNTIIDLLRNLWNLLACIGEVLGYVLRFVSVFFQTRASLASRLVAAESQLGICRRRIEQKGSSRFTAGLPEEVIDSPDNRSRPVPGRI